jgi:uncharacterized protein YjbI with pentapeptide repeats
MRQPKKRTSLVIACVMAFAFGDADIVSSAPSVTAKENLEKLIKTNSCKGCDLAGLNLNRMEFSGADLEGADLSLAKLFLTNLSGANLKNAILTGAGFGGADLGEADLRGADLRGTSLDGAYLGGTLLDGEFVTAKPYENIGVAEVEKEVYVSDQAKSKRNPETKEVKVAARRDFEEPPPTLAPKQPTEDLTVDTRTEQTDEVVQEAPPISLPKPPAAKKATPVQEIVVASSKEDVPVAVAEKKPPVETKQNDADMSQTAVTESPEENISEKAVEPEKTASAPPVVGKTVPETVVVEESSILPEPAVIAESPAVAGAEDNLSENMAEDTIKRDNLSRLLDTDRCFGCDLSGLDLSGKNLDGADLEQADLSGCNLEKVDLEEANLKGALLLKANLRNAKLKDADLYKADLTDADLTGADVKGAMFDGAELAGTVGYKGLSIMDN